MLHTSSMATTKLVRSSSCLFIAVFISFLALTATAKKAETPADSSKTKSAESSKTKSAESSKTKKPTKTEWKGRSFYEFVAKDSRGSDFEMSLFKGDVVLVVNVASEASYTDAHYKQLKKLQKEVGSRGNFHVVAFPCNQFGFQEPKSNEEIVKWATSKYDINFPLLAKIDVIGKDASPIYKNLVEQSGQAPDDNFWKYLVNFKGHVLGAWGPKTPVQHLRAEIEEALKDAKTHHDPTEL